jgi:hypothetical protein
MMIDDEEALRLRWPAMWLALAVAAVLYLIFVGLLAVKSSWSIGVGTSVLWYANQHVMTALRVLFGGRNYLGRASNASVFMGVSAVPVGTWLLVARCSLIFLVILPAFVLIDRGVRKRLFAQDPRFEPEALELLVLATALGELVGYMGGFLLRHA